MCYDKIPRFTQENKDGLKGKDVHQGRCYVAQHLLQWIYFLRTENNSLR